MFTLFLLKHKFIIDISDIESMNRIEEDNHSDGVFTAPGPSHSISEKEVDDEDDEDSLSELGDRYVNIIHWTVFRKYKPNQSYCKK